MWKPFRVQFGDLLQQLKDNTKLLELELSVATSREAMAFYTKLEHQFLNPRTDHDSSRSILEEKRGTGNYHLTVLRISWFNTSKYRQGICRGSGVDPCSTMVRVPGPSDRPAGPQYLRMDFSRC